MALTFLDLTNQVLRRLNEPELTDLNFAAATGIHAYAKDAVNNAINRIQVREREWPWNYNLETVVLTPDDADYDLPATARLVKWDSFFIVPADGSTPYSLTELDYEEWLVKCRSTDITGGSDRPYYVVRTPGNKIKLSPAPANADTLTYDWFAEPLDLTLYSSTTTIYDRFRHVIHEGAMARMHEFRDNFEMRDRTDGLFDDGIDRMRSELINRYEYVRGPNFRG